MRKTVLISIALILSAAAFAQDRNTRANQVLDKVTEKTTSFNTITIDFIYEMVNDGAYPDQNIKREGNLIVKGDMYHLEIAGQIVMSDGETLWTYIKDAEEVQINSVEEGEDMLTPHKLLSSYNEDYKSKLTGESEVAGQPVHLIELTPLERKNYSKVELAVDKEENIIKRITIFDKNGSQYIYSINEFKTDIPYEDSKFVFSEEDYPDAEIIDMR